MDDMIFKTDECGLKKDESTVEPDVEPFKEDSMDYDDEVTLLGITPKLKISDSVLFILIIKIMISY